MQGKGNGRTILQFFEVKMRLRLERNEYGGTRHSAAGNVAHPEYGIGGGGVSRFQQVEFRMWTWA
jgi:hypothetical protein